MGIIWRMSDVCLGGTAALLSPCSDTVVLSWYIRVPSRTTPPTCLPPPLSSHPWTFLLTSGTSVEPVWAKTWKTPVPWGWPPGPSTIAVRGTSGSGGGGETHGAHTCATPSWDPQVCKQKKNAYCYLSSNFCAGCTVLL